MVRSTRYGRDVFFLKRMLVFVGLLTVSIVILYGVDFYNIYRMYPMKHITAPVHSLQLAQGVTGNYPIWLYLAGTYMGKIMLWCGCGMVCYSIGYFGIMGKAFREETIIDETGN